MDANGFVVKIKANGTENDVHNLDKILDEYKVILSCLPTKDKGSFALNVLCILCRNLDKVPTWRDKVNTKGLLTLSIECVRSSRGLDRPERVKTLACIYHIHRQVVKQNTAVSPELILKLSYMPFEYDTGALLKEYCKTYWSILADRLTYIERLKTKLAITKLLPKLTEDVIKILSIYDNMQFCSNLLVFLIKKLNFLYNDSNKLNEAFSKIFESIDVKSFKKLTEKESLDLYVKLNECLYVIMENASKTNFKDASLDTIVRTCISLVGHNSDLFYCFQTFYLNSICFIFNFKSTTSYTETIFNNILISCETTEKLGYKTAMYATYPYINQFLRIYIEHVSSNKKKISEGIRETCLKLTLLLMKKLNNTEQLLKCEKCPVKSGLHDALRLSFNMKNLLLDDISKILPLYYSMVDGQYKILKDLLRIGCVNHDKCLRKLQTDTHNTAITLNKNQHYEYSIKLFDIYLINELKYTNDKKNLSRALYNKSICELDCKEYANALNNAYLSLIFSIPEGLTSDKYMSLVMDIKSKVLNEDIDNKLQLLTVLGACNELFRENSYGDLKPYLKKLKFSELLNQEFLMYAKLWPSVVPIAGVWRSLYDLVLKKYAWPMEESHDLLVDCLFNIVLETPSVVRTIHNDNYREMVDNLLTFIDGDNSNKRRVVQATLLFLKAEYDISDASLKYKWKITEHTVDPDQMQSMRTIQQEYEAMKCGVRALDMWTEVINDLDSVSSILLQNSLRVAEVFVHHFNVCRRVTHALRLAQVCCCVAQHVGDGAAYLRNAGVILHACYEKQGGVSPIIEAANLFAKQLMRNQDTQGAALGYLCELAIYYSRCGRLRVACELTRMVQVRVLNSYREGDTYLELAIGRLMEAQMELCQSGPSLLSCVNGVQRHYLAIANNASNWSRRRATALRLRARWGKSGVAATRGARALRLWRRARAAAAPALPHAAATVQATLYAAIANAGNYHDTQVKIDNHLKHIIGLQSNEPQNATTHLKIQQFTPKQSNLETMLDNMVVKKPTSPSLPCISVPSFKIPDFFTHNSCECYACNTKYSYIIACTTLALEASMYYRAKEFDIAKNYFDGVLNMFGLAELKFKEKDELVLTIAQKFYMRQLKEAHLEVLVEASYFEMSLENYGKSDDYIVQIHEILADIKIDGYMQNEISNLMIASAYTRRTKASFTGLEIEMDSLKLSPNAKTPESKFVPQQKVVQMVKDEELPKKRKVIKLNLDECDDEKDKAGFKVPVATKVIEQKTPRPKIVVTRPLESQETPKSEFFTPQSTPAEQFFTPMTSMKTYSRRNVVKNLENEFTPVRDKENVKSELKKVKTIALLEAKVDTGVEKLERRSRKVETGSVRGLKDKRSLVRATSPGKLVDEKTTRSKRRQDKK